MEGLFFIILISGVLVALSNWVNSSGVKGWLGERAVHKILTKSLDASRYTVLHDVTLNTPSGTSQIDHVAVSQYGIFVIETKNMSGWIFGSEYDPQWTQSFHRRKVRFQNPLRQNHAHIKALEELLDLDSSKFHSMIVFAGSAEFKTQMPATVMMLGGMLPHIQIRTSQLLDAGDVRKIVQTIEFSRMTPGAETNAAHIESLRATHNSATGAVEDVRSLMRQGIEALGLVKLAASLVVALVFALVANHFLQGIKGSFLNRSPDPQILPAQVSSTSTPKQAPMANSSLTYLEKLQRDQEARKRQQELDDLLAWKGSLMCGYSTDTMRCSCYDPKGGKVTIDFDECKALADKGTGAIRR